MRTNTFRARVWSPLSIYPEDRDWGFSDLALAELCREIDAKDDTPIDRDERRAWYDTLRDLVPLAHGFQSNRSAICRGI